MKIGKIFVAIIGLSIAGTAYLYDQLPEQIPVHWGIDGQIDRYGDRSFAFLTATLPLLLYGLFLIIPKIDPRKDSYDKHEKAYTMIASSTMVLIIGIHWTTMAFSLGFSINIPFVIKLSIGLLFILIGNYLPQVKHNYTLGIRTPWTLASEIVWNKTHRAGGYAFVILGLIWCGLAFVNQPWVFFICLGAIISFVILIFLYSYLLFRKI